MLYTRDEQIQISNTIMQQMGGYGKLKAMIGARDMFALDSDSPGLQFSFKGSKKANKVRIELTPDDLYNLTFYKINMRNIDRSTAPVEKYENIYEDMLIPVFEKTTGLYLHL